MLNQYYFLQKQAQQLLELQRDYNEYLDKLNAIINDFQKSVSINDESSQAAPEEKKNTFLVVNRNQDYLNSSLVDYLQENNYAKEVRLLKKSKRVNTAPPRTYKRRTRQRIGQPFIDIPRQIEHEISFSWPLDFSSFWISSYFGPRRKANGSPGYHYGLDLASLKGTPVKASASGTVVEAGFGSGYGKTIVIKHTKKYKTRYAHLSSIKVSVGDTVERGQVIGKVGNTGLVRSAGKDPSHLHFEVVVSDRKINPLWVLPKIS